MKDYTTFHFLYFFGKYPFSIKSKITFSEDVDIEILEKSLNEILFKHDYVTKSVAIQKDEYVFIDNDRPFVVLPYEKKTRYFNTEETNNHLAFVEADGKDIYFNICHCIATGYSLRFLVFDFVIDYINKKYNESFPLADKRFYEYESIEPKVEDFQVDCEFPKLKIKKSCAMPIGEHVFGALKRHKDDSILYEFDGNQLMNIIKLNDGTPATLFSALSYLTYQKVHPRNKKPISNFIFHNPLIGTKYEQYHGHFTHGVKAVYDTRCKNYSLEKLNLITRGALFLQTQSCYSRDAVSEILNFCDKIERTKGLFRKQLKYTLNHPQEGIKNARFTSFISYSGRLVVPGLEKYVKGAFALQDSQLIYEVSALNDKIFLTLNLINKTKKYEKAFEEVLNGFNIPFKKIGYQEKHLALVKVKKIKSKGD